MSYMGDGTVKPNWQQAQNLISQQTQIIISELVEAQRQIENWKRSYDSVKGQLEDYKTRPTAYTEGWYVKELGKERERRYAVESDLRRAREFMKLKDRAKIKVEMARDQAMRERDAYKNTATVLRDQAIKVESLEAANEQQAIAWKEEVRKRINMKEELQRYAKENERLMQIIRLGREGLRSEQW